MTNLQILTKKEISQLEQAPFFSGEERKKYFRITNLVRNRVVGFTSTHAQIGFVLHLGYFRATGKFALPKAITKKIWIMWPGSLVSPQLSSI